MSHYHGRVSRHTRLLARIFLVISVHFAVSPNAMAAKLACKSPALGTVTSITLSAVTVSPGVAVGTLLGSPSAPAIVNFVCDNVISADQFVTIQAGSLGPLDASNAIGGGNIKFATNIPGIAVQLTATPNQADAGPHGPAGSPGWELTSESNSLPSISTTFTAQLIKTGPIAPGNTGSLQLLQLTNYSYQKTDSATPYVTVILNPVAVTLSTCSVNMPSPNFTVTLPTISRSALQGAGSVAGTTPFNLTYACPTGWMLTMTLTTPSASSQPGVILSTTGGACTSSASNVGLRLLQGNQAVTFNSQQDIGASPNGALTIPYFVQYYQIASPVGAGGVCGTATYTLTYQ